MSLVFADKNKTNKNQITKIWLKLIYISFKRLRLEQNQNQHC